MPLLRSFLLLLLISTLSFAQLSSEQRVLDFQVLASLYAKRYAPANWKIEALKVNLFEISPWLERVRAAKDDLEFLEICLEYVASLRDGHSSFRMVSTFSATVPFFVDIYDGKVVVDAIDRALLPSARFNFAIGDELVSIDGVPVEELLEKFSKLRSLANPRTTRRNAADMLVFRSQTFIPRAIDLPESSNFLFRREDGETVEYRISWIKSGEPVRKFAPLPFPQTRGIAAADSSDYMAQLNEMRNYSVHADELRRFDRPFTDANGDAQNRLFLLGWGQRVPYFTLPTGFQRRLGAVASDYFFTGTYMADGLRIGYLRIPNFSMPAAGLFLLEREIAFFKQNTDGLVVDVSRNTGGGCIGLDIAARLIPNDFWFFSEQLRPTTTLLLQTEQSLRLARQVGAEQWVVDTYQNLLDILRAAQNDYRSLTGPWPACSTQTGVLPFLSAPTTMNRPWMGSNGEILAYEKPLIVLADELSVSFGDIFPAMMQDNQRGPIVGVRTGGLGGSTSLHSVGYYSESAASTTNSLVVRRQNIKSPELPEAPYIENIGVFPDVPLDYMTRENLLSGGRLFVEGFTRAMVEEIRRRR